MAAGAPDETWTRWHSEWEMAGKAKGFEQWKTRSKKIIKRYRDERPDKQGDGAEESVEGSRFNILWSNVQTLQPALFAKSPKPVVERRYLDRDEVGRTASVILERTLSYQLDDGNYKEALKKVVLDRLLVGRGTPWVRYEPKFMPLPSKVQPDVEDEGGEPLTSADEPDEQEVQDDPQEERDEQVASESVVVDYIDYRDFFTNAARTWEEVWWVDKRVYMTRDEMKARRFKAWDKVLLDWTPAEVEQSAVSSSPDLKDEQKRATIHETWDKRARKVYWWAEKWSDQMLDQKDDPLKLEGFFPCPKPLYATLTNDSLIPVPDFFEYQDQAVELDDLTSRITSLTKAIKAAGCYDASVDELKRMLEEGFENKLVPVDNWAEFSQKMGSNGVGGIWLLPIKDLAAVLLQLYQARDQVKQTLYEITGLSDIIRGQASGEGAKTATEQRIKGQFASMRLNDMQAEVARVARDTLRIMGEIVAEHFSPMTLFLISGYEQYAKEQWPPEPPQPNPMTGGAMGHNGGPPMEASPPPVADGGNGAAGGPPPGVAGPQPPAGQGPVMGAPQMPMGGQPIMLPPDPEMVARQKAAAIFQDAVTLLRDDKLRGFRIDIETDSLIEPDQQEMQKARAELMGAISQFLPQAMEAGQAMPALRPLLARLLMFFLRGFKASRDIEAAFEQFIDDMQKEAANPKPAPPSPEQIKAQAVQQQAQLDAAAAQAELQSKMQLMQAQAQSEAAARDQEMQLKEREFAMKTREMELKEQIAAAEHQREMERTAAKLQLEQRTAAINAASLEHSTGLSTEATERKHELNLETMEAKAAQAQQNGAGA